MPAAPELQALLSRRLRLVEGRPGEHTISVDDELSVAELKAQLLCATGQAPHSWVQDICDYEPSGGTISPCSALSGDAAAGGPAPVQKCDSSPAVLARVPGVAPYKCDQRYGGDWRRISVWSSRARMCDAHSRNTEAQLRPRTEIEALRLLNSELLEQVRSDANVKQALYVEREKERVMRDYSFRLETMALQCESSLEEMSARLTAEAHRTENVESELEAVQRSREVELREVSLLREEYHEVQKLNSLLQSSNTELAEDRSRFEEELVAQLNASWCSCADERPEVPRLVSFGEDSHSPVLGSEGRLRAALTGRAVPTEELRNAVASVDALLAQAKREVADRELRERRAAYEQLHAAMEGSEEDFLEEAISVGRRCGVGEEELSKAESRLEDLRSLTDADRAAQAAAKRLTETKRRSFQLVKRGEVAALVELLQTAEADGSPPWKGWKDHAGRTLLAYAKEVRAAAVQECLENLLAPPKPLAPLGPPPDRESSDEMSLSPRAVGTSLPMLERNHSLSPVPLAAGLSMNEEVFTPSLDLRQVSIASYSSFISAVEDPQSFDDRRASPSPYLDISILTPRKEADTAANSSPEDGEDEDHRALKTAAFRAVVKDDTVALTRLLERLPCQVWSQWCNKAGRDLITLSTERRAPGCYVLLARAQGILQERKPEVFEENETVWIMTPGELQPRHATVKEDTPGEADEVLVEYWDCEDPPTRIDKGLVLRAN